MNTVANTVVVNFAILFTGNRATKCTARTICFVAI
jgi:hypothetical protein